jgi:hypothetical protein
MMLTPEQIAKLDQISAETVAFIRITDKGVAEFKDMRVSPKELAVYLRELADHLDALPPGGHLA